LIQLGNGILVEADGRRYRFDPKRVVEGDVCMISHAHSDHLPSSFKSNRAICSEITADFVKARKKRAVEICRDDRVKMLDAGHIAGSSMFLLRGEEVCLYTGDFCTREKGSTRGAKPHKCDVLITEATYGRPRYVFPDHDEIFSVIRDWLEDLSRAGRSAVLYAYPLGKSQELSSALMDMPVVLHPAIAENNRILRMHGYKLPVCELGQGAPRPPFVYITPGYRRDAGRVDSLRRHGAKTAAFSGWALDREFISTSSVDEAFPVSDHCGFDELTEFVRRCGPSQVFTTHGFAGEFATHIRRSLGIPAQPLTARQRTLDHFC
jgi:putative mRNA 3-end processing factor